MPVWIIDEHIPSLRSIRTSKEIPMTKSFVICLHKAVDCILLDAIDTFPSDHGSLKRDISRLASLAKSRGLPVFTLDLPALGKHFDKCLSEGTYTQSNLPISGSLKGTAIPRLFSGMMLRVFRKCGMLRQKPCVNSIAFLRQLYAIGKKVRVNCERSRVNETLSQFYTEDAELPLPDLNWSGTTWEEVHRLSKLHSLSDYRPTNSLLRRKLESWWRCTRRDRKWSPHGPHYRAISSNLDRIALETVQQVADWLTCELGSFDPREHMPKHGPGAVSDLKRFSNKYEFPNWSEQLEPVFPQALFAFANYDSWVTKGGLINKPPVSKMCVVPKTQKGPRLIAAENTSNMWCQQILRRFVETGVSKHPILKSMIHFRDQTINQKAALKASIDRKSWTVDLSSASDRVSCRFVERMFRKNSFFLHGLIAARTPQIKQVIDKRHPDVYSLRKYTTMGSACTFPIETVIFLTFCISSILIVRGQQATSKNIARLASETRVFGDDIIIPNDSGQVLEILLTHFDFKVNQSKTHRNGSFRESCGMEAYEGHDVTPAYILQVPDARKPETIISAVECSNNFYKKGWWRTAAYIKSIVPRGNIPVVHRTSGCFGFTSNLHPENPKRVRWNEDLHVYETLITQPKAVSKKFKIRNESALLQFFTEEPDPTVMWESGVAQKPRLRLEKRWVNLLDVTMKSEIGC